MAAVTACGKKDEALAGDDYTKQVEPATGKMTYRTDPHTGKQVSLLGYGMMRLPTKDGGASSRESQEEIDQEQVNRLVPGILSGYVGTQHGHSASPPPA